MKSIKALIILLAAQFVLLNNVSYGGAVGSIDIHPQTRTSPYYASIPAIEKQAAVQFVKSSGLHKSLSLLLLDSVKQDAIVENAILVHGFSDVKSSVVANIKLTSNRYRQEWEALLAGIYSSQFSDQELKSILDKGENSPYFSQFILRQNEMGTSNRLASSDIFKKAHSELIETLRKSFGS